MHNNTTSPPVTRADTPVDIEDLPGTYTLDDGHPGSYDHEAVVSVGTDATVTVKCTCGAWERIGEVRFGDDGDTAVLAAWEAHVAEATGRTTPAEAPDTEALTVELEQVRETYAKLRALYDHNVAALLDQLDAAHDVNDRIIAVNARLSARVIALGGAA